MNFFSKLAAAALLIAASVGFSSVSAQAASYSRCENPGTLHCPPPVGKHPRPHGFNPHHWHGGSGIGFEFRFGNVDPRYDYYRPYRIYRPVPVIRKVRFCSNDAAIHKARSLGIRHIRAIAYHDHIVIKGRKHGHRVHLAIARARGCPIIRY